MKLRSGLTLRGTFVPEHWRPMENLTRVEQGLVLARMRIHGAPYGLIHKQFSRNIVTNEGLDKVLDSLLHNDASATWYCLVVESDTDAAAGMTHETPVFTESTSYDEATRPEYVDVASSSQSITNTASPATFTISATKTFYGAALADKDTKNDQTAANCLLCYSKFGTSRALVDDDVLNLTYIMNAADA